MRKNTRDMQRGDSRLTRFKSCLRLISPSTRSWIDLARVLLDHPVAVVLRRERLDGALHHRDPLPGNSAVIAVVKHRHDVRLERSVKRLCVERVDLRYLRHIVAVTDRETIRAVITFEPPAVEYREI